MPLRPVIPRRQAIWTLSAGIFALKFLAGALIGAAIVLALWDWRPFSAVSSDAGSHGWAYNVGRQESRSYQSLADPASGSGVVQREPDRGAPSNFRRP